MTVEAILAAMQAIIDEAKAGAADPNADPALTDEQAQRYEDLERSLAAAQKSAEIVKRQAAYKTVAAPSASFGASEVKKSEYERAFESYIRTGQKNGDLIQRAQSEGVGSAGGFMVPEEWRGDIVEQLKNFGGLQAAAKAISTSDGRPLSWLTAANDLVTTNAEITAENALWSTGADVSFGTRTLGAYKYTTVGASTLPLKVPFELLQDSNFDIKGYISNIFARRIARKLANDLVNGTGVSEPQGIISTQGGIASGTARAASASPTYAELLATVHALDPEYRMSASWLINDATLALLRGVVDGSSRPLLWNQNDDLTGALKGSTLLGFPVVVDQAMPTTAASGSAKAILFGDLSEAYVVRSVKSFEMIVMNELYAQNGQVGLMGWARYDGMVNDPNAAIVKPNAA